MIKILGEKNQLENLRPVNCALRSKDYLFRILRAYKLEKEYTVFGFSFILKDKIENNVKVNKTYKESFHTIYILIFKHNLQLEIVFYTNSYFIWR